MSDVAFWDGIAEKYSRQPVANPDAFDRKIDITRSLMSASDRVLDIGCGTGSLALRLAPFAAEVHGLDLSPEMIRIARGKARSQDISNATFHVGAFDEHFQAFEPDSLDGLCAYSILHLLEDRPSALARIFTLLKPGGFFVSSTVCLADSRVPWTPVLRVMQWLGKAPMVKIISGKLLEGEIREAGFENLSRPDVGAKPMIAFMVARKPL